MEDKTLTDRAKEAVVTCMEHNQAEPEAVAALGKAYAAIAMVEMPANAAKEFGELLKQLEEIN